MRVIAGRFRSRKLKTVESLQVRPTPDRLRETLFSILLPRLADMTFVDAYAGSGAVGIEALSRGARHAILIEKNGHAVAVIRDNLRMLGLEGEATILRGSVTKELPNLFAARKPDIVFLDPPYERASEYTDSMAILGATPVPLAIVQHPSRMVLIERVGQISKVRIVRQGDNSLSFYEPLEE